MTIDNYIKCGVNVEHIQRVDGSSGVAPIWVDQSGQNRIIVVSGANDKIDAKKATSSLLEIGNLNVLVGQFEIPMSVTQEVFSVAKNNDITTILNPAPAKIPSDELLQLTDWFVPNEVEFSTITGMDAYNDENLISYANTISSNLIVTLGENGAALVSENSVVKISAPHVTAIDTTGAGDAFVGSFAYGLASKMSKQDSIKLALEKATNSVTKKGTQSSYKD